MSGLFIYANPPVIRWGAGSLRELGAELDRCGGGTRPFVVTTRSVAGNAVLWGALEASLAGRSISGRALVSQHAPTREVDSAAEMARGVHADCLLSFGGGSAIDTAKLVALKLSDEDHRQPAHIAIPTTLSVAELASGAGYTDEAGNKVGRRDPRGLPSAVVYDARLALHTPIELWLSTGIRALDHAVETILAEGEHPFSDVLAAASMRRLFASLPAARERPDDLEVRTENQLAAWFSFTLPAAAAAGLSHVMGKQIGARHGIPHGITSCLLLPHVMRYLAPRDPARASRLPYGADEVAALIDRLGLPQHIAAYGLGEPDLRAAAESLGGSYPAGDLLAIYLRAL
jgi:maleylacetate reductase